MGNVRGKTGIEGKRSPLLSIVISLLVSFMVSAILLLLLTALSYYVELSGTVTGVLLVLIYVLGPFSGAFVLGKKMKEKRFLWGMALGLLYYAVYVLIAVICKEENAGPMLRDYIKVFLAILPGGILGGMFS